MMQKSVVETAQNVLDMEMNALKLMRDELNGDFTKAVEMILNVKGRVIISGMGKSGHVGQKIAATMASTGTPSFFVHPSEASHGDLGMLTREDLLITISNSGESREMADIISFSRRFGIPMIAITSNPQSSMGKAADLVLAIPDKKRAPEACILGLAPTTSTTTTMAMGDCLAVALMQARSFSAEDFHSRHPGGKLGNVLLKVCDLMAKGSSLPLVSANMMMSDALPIMTAKSLGCLGVIDENGVLIGVITDGDLRRHMAADLIVRCAKDIMTANPKTISADILAAEAVRILNESKITNIFVVNEMKQPIGLLHIHHCLQAGVV